MMSGKELSMVEEDAITSTPMLDFYRDKSVFVTGGTGFIGKLVVAKLLKANVKEVILLSRPKKGKSNEERANEIFSGIVFCKLQAENNGFISRVKIVDGDLQKPNLGLTEEAIEYIQKNVQITIHAAADVRFDQTLKKAVEVNVRSTRDLILLMEKTERFEVMVYVSTVYSNCNRDLIGEEFYPPPVNPEQIIKFVEHMEDSFADKIHPITTDLIAPWPNTYVYTKAITEDLVRRFGTNLPIAVVRPSIVVSTVEDPIPGWVDNIYGLNGVIAGVALGVIRTMIVDDYVIGDIIPADHVVSAIMAVAFTTYQDHNAIKLIANETANSLPNGHANDSILIREPKIYNIVSSPENPIDWQHIYDYSIAVGKIIPPAKGLWIVSFTTTTNEFLHTIMKFFFHLLPAFLMDTYLRAIGKKPRVYGLYNKVHKFSKVIQFFATKQWQFSNSNAKSVWKRLNKQDQEIFSFDIKSIVWMDFFHTYLQGLRKYIANETEDNLKGALLLYKKRLVMHTFLRLAAVGLVLYAFYAFFKLLHLL